MTATTPQLDYYNFDKLFSYNGTFNFIIGARGVGKTYGAKRKAIIKYLRKSEQFIYLRRYKDELKKAKDTFFADIAHEFPDYDFRVNGYAAERATAATRGKENKDRDWEIIGYFISLSTAQSQKSVAFPRVTAIIFDEFIIEKGATHYLPNEAIAFQNFYATVDRWKDKTRVLFLANSVSIMNPYFLQYDIKPDTAGEISTYANGFIVCHFVDAKKFSEGVFKTKFGQFIKDTDYADYAVNSEFSDNHDQMLGLKPANAKYYCTMETKAGYFSVWIDYSGPYYWMQEKRPKKEIIWTILPENMDEGKTLVTYSDKVLSYMRSAFRNGNAWFDTPKSRNAFIEIFKR